MLRRRSCPDADGFATRRKVCAAAENSFECAVRVSAGVRGLLSSAATVRLGAAVGPMLRRAGSARQIPAPTPHLSSSHT